MDRCISKKAEAFTLLETLLALGLAATLLGGVYAIASGTTQLSSEISRDREKHQTEQAFLALCRKTLSGLSAAADLKLRTSPSGGGTLAEIVISGDPAAFGFSGVPHGSTAVVLASTPETGGTRSVSLRYLGEQDVDAFDGGRRDVGLELPLLRDVRQFDWRFFDRRGNRWKPAWDIRSGRPAQAELILGIGERASTRHVFWIPDLQSPPMPIPRPVRVKSEDDDN